MSKPPKAAVKSGSSGGMRFNACAGHGLGDLAAERRGECLARADRVGQQRAAALQILAKPLAFLVGEAEVVPAVHEDQVVAEQIVVGDVDQLGAARTCSFKSPCERCGAGSAVRRRVVAAAAVAELGDFDDAAAGIRIASIVGQSA